MLPAEDLCQLDQAQYAWSLLTKIKELVAEFWFAAYWIQLYNVLIRELVGSWGLFAEFWWGLGRVIPAGEGKGATLLWSSRVNSPRLQVRWATLLFLKAFKFLLRVAKCKTLHRSNLSNSILPQRKCVNCDHFTLKLNEIERIGSFWGKIWMVSNFLNISCMCNNWNCTSLVWDTRTQVSTCLSRWEAILPQQTPRHKLNIFTHSLISDPRSDPTMTMTNGHWPWPLPVWCQYNFALL